jgi:hypothetical protein
LDDEFDKLLKKCREETAHNVQIEVDDGEPEVKYVFMVFRDECALEYIKRAYNIGYLERMLTMYFGHLICPKR